MKIFNILADETPTCCLECPFAHPYESLKGRGKCLALPDDKNSICMEYYADYRRHDCPILISMGGDVC